jgi:hypothetical protein
MRTLAAIAILLLTAIPAKADQIVGFGQLGSLNTFFAVNNGDGTTSLDVLTGVAITNIITGATDPNAVFEFEAESIDAASLLAGVLVTQHFEGTFTLRNQADTINYLYGSFGGALILGGDGGTGAVLSANTVNLDPLSMQSDLIALFDPMSFSLSLSNLSPTLGISGGTINSFNASFTGTADATIPEVPVPEPASLFLLGTGLVGLAASAKKRLFRK